MYGWKKYKSTESVIPTVVPPTTKLAPDIVLQRTRYNCGGM